MPNRDPVLKALRRHEVPAWWRDAKLGAWAHWDPQSMPEQGDWYAYRMYQEGSADFNYHVSHFGDPSTYGYKDICQNWVIDQWDPSSLMDLYVQMGAKFFMALGSHHDDFDTWASTYQPWNAVRVGVKKDIVGTWAPIARAKGMRFGSRSKRIVLNRFVMCSSPLFVSTKRTFKCSTGRSIPPA